MKSIETTVFNLCARIDDLEREKAYWKEKYQSLFKEYSEQQNEKLKDVEKGDPCEFCDGAGHVSRDSDGRAIEYSCSFCNGSGIDSNEKSLK